MKSHGLSIGNLNGQLVFLMQELAGYPNVINHLRNTSTVFDASTVILREFERPADSSNPVAYKRCSFALAFYYHYSN